MHDVIDNPDLQRFELVEQGQTAFADYRAEAGRIAGWMLDEGRLYYLFLK